jgi:hypothetical protein
MSARSSTSHPPPRARALPLSAAASLRSQAIVLPVLLEKGIMSTVGEIRGLAIETLMKVVKNAGKEQLRPHMAALVTCMLESLSVRVASSYTDSFIANWTSWDPVRDELARPFRHSRPILPTQCSMCRGLHVRRVCLGVVPRSRAIISLPVP